MVDGSGSRATWARVRRSRLRSRCALANELILVVEDNDKNRKLVRDVLTFKGYEIIEAETGEEGVRLAQERHPSLVLMAIRRPGIAPASSHRAPRPCFFLPTSSPSPTKGASLTSRRGIGW